MKYDDNYIYIYISNSMIYSDDMKLSDNISDIMKLSDNISDIMKYSSEIRANFGYSGSHSLSEETKSLRGREQRVSLEDLCTGSVW